MKYIKLLLICLLAACSSKPEIQKPITQAQNETFISDSAYYFFNLNHLDTINGFQEFFKDSSRVTMIEYYYDQIKSNQFTKDINAIESLFFAIWLRASVIKLVRDELVLFKKEEPLFIGRHTGTMNTAFLRLRPNNEFDIHWTGWWLSSELYQGYYRQSSDTLFFSFETKRPARVRDTMLIQEEQIAPMNVEDYSLVHFFRLE